MGQMLVRQIDDSLLERAEGQSAANTAVRPRPKPERFWQKRWQRRLNRAP